ncbi:MAG TPA: hypothetical protein VJQ83_08480, partial [Tepidiformaceae bacterium]|nr:hypothetical protein [Tepidiformaceae bacterium]
MPKAHTKYTCQQCGYESAKWLGRCPDCGEWNSLVETIVPATKPASGRSSSLAPVGRAEAVPLPQVRAEGFARASTGSTEMDRVLGGGIVPGSLVLLGGEPGIGKCVTGDTRVLDPATGDYRPITDWAEASRPVLALDPISHGLSKRPVEAFYAQGVRLIVEVTTRLGRRLRCTSDHPLLTVDGWVPIEELVPGARIAAPRALPYFGSDSMAEAEVKLIAYVLSDGAAHSSVNVTTALPEVVDDLRSIATRFGMTLRTFKKRDNRAATYAFVYPRGARAEVRVQVRDALRRMQAAVGITWGEWARRAAIDYWTLRVWRNGFAVPSEAELRLLADAVGMPLSELAPEARSLAEKTTPVARLLERVGLRHVNARQKFVP